jgi:hypothetical protein
MKRVVIIVVALLAFAASAGAASHYLITSTHQIKPSVLNQLHGAKGPRGYTGTKGATGPVGPQGGFSAITVADATSLTYLPPAQDPTRLNILAQARSDARCPIGTTAISGGWSTGSYGDDPVTVVENVRDNDGQGWHVTLGHHTSEQVFFAAYAYCAKGA